MKDKTLSRCFLDSFLRQRSKRAIAFFREGRVETEISYIELNRLVNRMAHTLQTLGVEKGDRVIFFLEKSLLLVIGHIALQKLGAVSVPLNPQFKTFEMEYLLKDADPKLVISGSTQQTMVREIDPSLNIKALNPRVPFQDLDFFLSASDEEPDVEIHSDDPGLIIYTSGTTGRPKGAVLTQTNLVHDALNVIKRWEISESDVMCHSLPLFHVHGMCFALHTSLMAGSTVLLLDRFSPETVTELLKRKEGDHVCTLYMAVPSMYGKMMDYLGEKREDFSHMRLWTSGSAPLLVKDFERIRTVFGKEPVEREGMTETGMNFSNPLRGIRKPGSIGVPMPDLQVKIVDPDTFQEVEAGQTGEIWLKGPCITPGYWRKPEETAKAFEKDWFRTGDLGHMDEEGYYYLTDRIKHIIISGGENISPKEVESVINQLEDVVESSVVGIPDEKWGEKLVAAVVTKPGSSVPTEEIRGFCKAHLHNWKCPKDVLFVKELPKNTMGKVLKEEVQKLFNA
jgi:malonyl-CoA/methylmalonyl-CoA synthetase